MRVKGFLFHAGLAGRLLGYSAAGGVLAAGMMVPLVAGTGIFIRDAADGFTGVSLTASGLPQRSEILDRNGHLLAYVYSVDMPYYDSAQHAHALLYSGWDRQPVDYSQISKDVVNAIVGIEDDRYWLHGAIDLKGTIRAAVNDVEHKPVQGGSTIAQQYVKNVLLLQAEMQDNTAGVQEAAADTLGRKLNELRMAMAIEHRESKQDILAGYLNAAYFGNQAYGIQAAAETYFSTTAARLTLTQAATLAGIVEDPSEYDPVRHPATALERRDTVLARMAQTDHGITAAQAAAAQKAPLGLRPGPVQSGCESASVGTAGFFCQYVEEVFLRDPAFGATPVDRARLLTAGGLKIYTTLDPQDQQAATSAVNYVEPYGDPGVNPGNNAAVEAVVQPGTGQVRALAEDRPYGSGRGQTEIDYAVNTAYGGSTGVQTGSSSKLFTLVTALEHGYKFGYTDTVPYAASMTGFYDCQGRYAGTWHVVNASSGDKGTYSLYTGTTASINTFYAHLEQRVGLCNVVRTAQGLGMTWADGTSLMDQDGPMVPADDTPSFTLGSVNVSPLNMSAAYAAMAARGQYCAPVAIDSIATDSGGSLPVPSAGCHHAVPAPVADAVNYILQGVLGSGGTASGMGLSRPAAGKTGTSNVISGNGTPYAAFAGYTPGLTGFVSVFYPQAPEAYGHVMGGSNACFRTEYGGENCPGEMYGADAPASVWHMSFDHADLGPAFGFVGVPGDSPFNSKGNGQHTDQKPGGGGGGASGPGNGLALGPPAIGAAAGVGGGPVRTGGNVGVPVGHRPPPVRLAAGPAAGAPIRGGTNRGGGAAPRPARAPVRVAPAAGAHR